MILIYNFCIEFGMFTFFFFYKLGKYNLFFKKNVDYSISVLQTRRSLVDQKFQLPNERWKDAYVQPHNAVILSYITFVFPWVLSSFSWLLSFWHFLWLTNRSLDPLPISQSERDARWDESGHSHDSWDKDILSSTIVD